MRSSSGPGIVSATFAVAMNMHAAQVELDVEVVVAEAVVLRRVEHLEQRRARVAAPVGADLVDLVEHDHRVHRPGVAQRADQPARERADVRPPVTADLGLVADAAERHADELCVPVARAIDSPIEVLPVPGGPIRVRIAPERLSSVIPRSTRSFLTAMYSTIRSLTSSSPAWSASSTSRACCGIEPLVGALAPRHGDQPVQVGADHARLGRLLAHPLEPAELLLGLLADVPRASRPLRSWSGTPRRSRRRPRRAPCGSTPSACAGSTRAAASRRRTRRRRGSACGPGARPAARAGIDSASSSRSVTSSVCSSLTLLLVAQVGRVAAGVGQRARLGDAAQERRRRASRRRGARGSPRRPRGTRARGCGSCRRPGRGRAARRPRRTAGRRAASGRRRRRRGAAPAATTARAPPGSRTRSATSATVPTLANSFSCLGTSRTRSSSPASIASVSDMPGKTTTSSSGTSRRRLISWSSLSVVAYSR